MKGPTLLSLETVLSSRPDSSAKIVASCVLFLSLCFVPVLPILVFKSSIDPLPYTALLLGVSSSFLLLIPLESILSIWASIPSSNSRPTRDKPLSLSLVICAYLPNEEAIILDTIKRLLAIVRSGCGDQIILSYRTSSTMLIESKLQEIARSHSCLHLLKVTRGEGKADQLNEALRHVTGNVVYIIDADAVPDSGVLAELCSAPFPRYQVVQGRNMIRNTSHLLGRVVAVEFAAKYMVSHFARSHFANVAYFCGSNAAWLREAARITGFANTSLVEDVEASVRADIAGFRIMIDPRIAATELAPLRLKDWWRQRRRWAQGWLDVGALHLRTILTQSQFSLWKKLNWTYVIYGRRVLYGLATSWMVVLTLLVALQGDVRGARMLAVFVYLQLLSGIVQSLAVSLQCRRFGESRIRSSWLVTYAVLYPAYDFLKNAVTIAAVAESIAGRRQWAITPRPTTACLGKE